jgi:hypothetical protein
VGEGAWQRPQLQVKCETGGERGPRVVVGKE